MSDDDQPSADQPSADQPRPDPIAETILALLAARGPRASVSPVEAAQAFAATRAKPGDPPELWRRYLAMVRQQGLHLARKGQLAILRKGQPIDPHKPFKGVVRWTLPPDGGETRG